MEWKKKKRIIWIVAATGAVLAMGGCFIMAFSFGVGFLILMLGMCTLGGVMGFCMTD
jgi:hypothetical protein